MELSKYNICNCVNNGGFALLQLAIGVIVLGIIATGFIQLQTTQKAGEIIRETQGNISSIENAINLFYIAGNARYPCPARLDAANGDDYYGAEQDCSDAGLAAMKECSDTNWRNDGICKTDAGADPVVIGAVPFQVLNISEEYTLDYWGNKILYAVAFQKTREATFDLSVGTVKVHAIDDPDDAGADATPDEINFSPDGADFILVSHGENALGSFNRDGAFSDTCPAGAAVIEKMNCDYDDVFLSRTHPENPDRTATNSVVGDLYYDDDTRFQTKVPLPLWFLNTAYTDNVMTSSEKVGIGTNSPQFNLQVKDGNMLVDDNIETKYYCDETMSNCFITQALTKSEIDFSCSHPAWGEQGLVELSGNKFRCMSTLDRGTGATLDPNGKAFMVDGIASGGTYEPSTCAGKTLAVGFNPITRVLICQN